MRFDVDGVAGVPVAIGRGVEVGDGCETCPALEVVGGVRRVSRGGWVRRGFAWLGGTHGIGDDDI